MALTGRFTGFTNRARSRFHPLLQCYIAAQIDQNDIRYMTEHGHEYFVVFGQVWYLFGSFGGHESFLDAAIALDYSSKNSAIIQDLDVSISSLVT
jgi:hypothetical protein